MSGSQVVNGGTLLRLWTPIRAWLAAQATKNCSWLFENINNRYSRFAKRIARKYLDWTFGIGFLTLILLIIYFKQDLFGAKPWPGIFWMVSGLLSSAAIYYLLARTIFPKAFPQRIRIRAFTPLREKSTYNGQAIARLLELEMQPPDKSKEAPSRVGSEPKVPSVNVSLAGTTIPLDFIWGRIDRWILGPIYTIEGIISESDRAITIDAWSTERAVHWRARSSPDLDCDPWRSAIVDLADQVRDSFGHYQELRDKRVDQSRYQEAIYLAERVNKSEPDTTLAHLYLSAGRLEDAELAFKAFESNETEDRRSDALLGLAAVRSAKGHHSEAIKLLKKVHGSFELQAKLDEAMLLSYRRKFTVAVKILESLAPHIEGNIERILKAKRRGLAVEVLRSKLGSLNEEEQSKLFDYLGQLEGLYQALGRSAEGLGNLKYAEHSYLLAVEVVKQRSSLWVPYHVWARGLGFLLKDVAWLAPDSAIMYDHAMIANHRCWEDANDCYRENPGDISALISMAWAMAGKLGCLVKKLDLKTEVDSAEVRQQVLMDSEQLAQLIPRERLQEVVAQASKRTTLVGEQGEETIHPIETLDNEQTKRAARLVDNLLRVLDPPRALYVMNLILDRNQSDNLAQSYFTQLAQKADNATTEAEGFFGLACVHAICGRYYLALRYLAEAIDSASDCKNRAQVDGDLRFLRADERYGQEFAEIVRWDWVSTTPAYH